jgi:hypothetical protein
VCGEEQNTTHLQAPTLLLSRLDTMDHPQLHASGRVFAIPELVELILYHLSMFEVLPLSSVSTTFYHTIRSSPSLKRKLFLTQPHAADIPNYAPSCQPAHYHDPSSSSSLTNNPTITRPPFHGPMYTRHLDKTLLNPALEQIFPNFTIRPLIDGNGWWLLTFQGLPTPINPIGPNKPARPSWKSMLLTAQPLTRLTLEPAALHVDPTMMAPLRGLSSTPNPQEAARIAALYQRISTRRENSPRFGGSGDRPAALPVQATLRWAAARGEACSEGWVWGSSLEFVSGKKPDSGVDVQNLLVDETGIRIGQLERVVRAGKWDWWVCRVDG